MARGKSPKKAKRKSASKRTTVEPRPKLNRTQIRQALHAADKIVPISEEEIERKLERLRVQHRLEIELMQRQIASEKHWKKAWHRKKKYRKLSRDGTKAKHESLLRHLPEDAFKMIQNRLNEAFGTFEQDIVFFQMAADLRTSVQEVYTLFWSP